MSGRSLRLLDKEARFMDLSSGRNKIGAEAGDAPVSSLSGSKKILWVCGSEVIRVISS